MIIPHFQLLRGPKPYHFHHSHPTTNPSASLVVLSFKYVRPNHYHYCYCYHSEPKHKCLPSRLLLCCFYHGSQLNCFQYIGQRDPFKVESRSQGFRNNESCWVFFLFVVFPLSILHPFCSFPQTLRVPQSSVLGLFLFFLYSISDLIQYRCHKYHLYSNSSQIYISSLVITHPTACLVLPIGSKRYLKFIISESKSALLMSFSSQSMST